MQNRRVAGDDRPRREFISAQDKHVDHHRRRRHRGRLPGDRSSPGLQERPPVRDRAPAPRQPGAHQPLAPVVQRLPGLLGPRGGGHPRILDQHPAVPGRERPRPCARDGPCRDENRTTAGLEFVEVPGTEKVYPADLVLLAMGFVGPGAEGHARAVRRRARRDRATSRPMPTSGRASPRSSRPAT